MDSIIDGSKRAIEIEIWFATSSQSFWKSVPPYLTTEFVDSEFRKMDSCIPGPASPLPPPIYRCVPLNGTDSPRDLAGRLPEACTLLFPRPVRRPVRGGEHIDEASGDQDLPEGFLESVRFGWRVLDSDLATLETRLHT